jgi:hypothetical protein
VQQSFLQNMLAVSMALPERQPCHADVCNAKLLLTRVLFKCKQAVTLAGGSAVLPVLQVLMQLHG